eukprot:g10785.t1
MGENGVLAKVGWTLVAIVAVPLVLALVLAWSLVGFLCSLQGCQVFFLVAALVVTSCVVDKSLGLGSYAFDSSLLDPVCVLLAMYVSYLFLLRHHDSSAVLVAQRRRLAALPIAVAVAVYLCVKLAAVHGDDSQDRWGWKLLWLWCALVSSVVVYVSMARLWTDTSMPRLEGAEASLLKTYGKVEFEQTVVAGLGTVCVKGFHEPYSDSGPGSTRLGGGSSPQKPILVLVHGYAAGNGFWMFILKELSAHFRVVCVEMYGCGRSDRLPFNAKGPVETEKVLVESLERWREEMGIEEMVLCGHSLGGMVSSAYAMAYPNRIRKLFLLSPAGVGGITLDADATEGSLVYKVYSFLWTRGWSFLGVLRWAGPFGVRMAKFVIARRLSWVPETAKIKEVDADMLGQYVYQLLALPASGEKIIFPLLDPMLRAYRPVLETLQGGGGGSDTSSGDGEERQLAAAVGLEEAEGRGISCPVSIIYGSPDRDWMPHRHGVALAESLTRQGIKANVYSVPEAGHTLIIDNPKDFTRIFLEAYFNAGV